MPRSLRLPMGIPRNAQFPGCARLRPFCKRGRGSSSFVGFMAGLNDLGGRLPGAGPDREILAAGSDQTQEILSSRVAPRDRDCGRTRCEWAGAGRSTLNQKAHSAYTGLILPGQPGLAWGAVRLVRAKRAAEGFRIHEE
jgi:hypothetical protein